MQYSNEIPRSHFYLDFLTQPLWPALLSCLRLPPLEPHLTSSLSLNRLKLVPASGPLYWLFICNLCFSVSHSSLLLTAPHVLLDDRFIPSIAFTDTWNFPLLLCRLSPDSKHRCFKRVHLCLSLNLFWDLDVWNGEPSPHIQNDENESIIQ